jgi:hypothetical protein
VAHIIQPGEAEAASFNDDSSPDARLTAGLKVSINAQVIPESSLDWYFRVLQLCGSIRGELKSAEVWQRFDALRGDSKDRIWAGLSKVHIHIVDPRPYRRSFDKIVERIIPFKDPSNFLRERLAAKDPWAIWLSEQGQFFMADQILRDSVGARVYSISKFVSEFPTRVQENESRLDDTILELNQFGQDAKPLVRKASAWSAKSAATFHQALDCFLSVDAETAVYESDIIRKRMKSRVLDSHTFDKGDQKHLDLLEKARGNILDNLREPTMPGEEYVNGDVANPYCQADSKDSYLIQAADIAAGIASKLLETQNLVFVVQSFEYVTYNGHRFSVSDAEEYLRRTGF